MFLTFSTIRHKKIHSNWLSYVENCIRGVAYRSDCQYLVRSFSTLCDITRDIFPELRVLTLSEKWNKQTKQRVELPYCHQFCSQRAKKNELTNLLCLQIDFSKIMTEVNKISLKKTTEAVAERAEGWRGVWKCAHQKCITLSSGLTLSN